MSEDNRMPNFWWCPTHHLYRGGDQRPCADAVRLVPAPPAPRVFFPGDTVPAGVVTAFPSDTDPANRMMLTPAQVWRWPAELTCIEVPIPSREEWQAAVDRARDARADAEWQHADGVNP